MRWWVLVAVGAALFPIDAAAEDSRQEAGSAVPEHTPKVRKADAAEPGERVIREQDKVIYEKETRVDFNDGNIDGSLTRPDGDVVRSRKKSEFQSMIQQRRDFTEELIESVDE